MKPDSNPSSLAALFSYDSVPLPLTEACLLGSLVPPSPASPGLFPAFFPLCPLDLHFRSGVLCGQRSCSRLRAIPLGKTLPLVQLREGLNGQESRPNMASAPLGQQPA